MKVVTFILPSAASKPVGGFKIIFEYANRLIKDNYQVNIVLPATLLWQERKIKEKIKGIIRYPYFKIKKSRYEPFSWFPLDKNIKILWVPTLEEKYIPNGDFVFATACETAEYVNRYTEIKGKKYYLIQSYENWSFTEERLVKTWKMNLQKIVISKYLSDKAKEIDEKSIYIENGLDFKNFYIEGTQKKETNTIMMLFHENEKVKQSKKAIHKFINLKKYRNELKLVLFGTSERPNFLPDWIEYYQMPTKDKLRELYNRATLFVSPSNIEGWALPPAEAMQCGTCVCVTNIPGHEYVEHLKTGYKIDKDLENLESEVEKLLDDRRRLLELGEAGNKYIQKFTWEKAYMKLKSFLEEDKN